MLFLVMAGIVIGVALLLRIFFEFAVHVEFTDSTPNPHYAKVRGYGRPENLTLHLPNRPAGRVAILVR